ncbi:MAG: glycosyltransferase family 4 protein [Bacteroidota bacterium]
MSKRKKVLIITYYWPPGSGPGVQRFLKMSKFLYEFGWEPIILTVKNGSYPSTDYSLLNDIPQKLKVYKTKTIEPFTLYNKLTGGKGKQVGVGMIGLQDKKSLIKKLSLFIRANIFLPDARRGWIPFAYKEANKIHNKTKLDAIVTTGPPHSTHFIGLKLKKHLSLPWLVDMRDPWSNNFFNKALPRTHYTKKLEKKFEDKILKNADFVTTVSPGLKEEFQHRNQNIEIIYNGYDQEDIPEPIHHKSSTFSLSYIGNMKPNQNIKALWEAIKELCEEIDGFKKNFRISLTGNLDASLLEALKRDNLDEIANIQQFVPHNQATELMNRSQLLLFIVPKTDSNKLIITGKLFEYIATCSPILSIGPVDGDAAKILAETERDPMWNYTDKEGIKNTILKYYFQWLQNDSLNFKHPSTDFKKFSRYKLTERLSKILNHIS